MNDVLPMRSTRTSKKDNSIWVDPSEDVFRQDLVRLETLTNSVPIAPLVCTPDSHNTFSNSRSQHSLPLASEQQLVDDLAFLAAVGEGAQSVSAACLEEHSHGTGLTVRIAAVDALDDAVQTFLSYVASIMVRAASVSAGVECSGRSSDAVQVFQRSVAIHSQKVLGRLRSCHWNKPRYLSRTHKKPLWQDFSNLLHRVQFAFSKKESGLRKEAQSALTNLTLVYEQFEVSSHSSTAELVTDLSYIIKSSFYFCMNESIQIYHQRLTQLASVRRPTSQISSAIKSLRQIEKIAAHWRVPNTLLGIARSNRSLFRHGMTLRFLPPYASIPASISYEPWAKDLHVHPEVQLIVHYDLLHSCNSGAEKAEAGSADSLLPRVIGSSKLYCYLCYLFIRFHGGFLVANTHGRLYDQWTIPDLVEYGEEMVNRYRGIIKDMHEEVLREIGPEAHGDNGNQVYRWREEPMTSRQNLLEIELDVSHRNEPSKQHQPNVGVAELNR